MNHPSDFHTQKTISEVFATGNLTFAIEFRIQMSHHENGIPLSGSQGAADSLQVHL